MSGRSPDGDGLLTVMLPTLNWLPATLLNMLFVAWKLGGLVMMDVEMKDGKRPTYLSGPA
jgi:hypothetical protein